MGGKMKSLAALLVFGSGVGVLHAQMSDVDRIVAEGKGHNQALQRLRELTNIGPRVTGSPQLAEAQQWAMAKFKSFGLTNVHLDKWGEVPVGFYRGPKQIGHMVSPYDTPIVFTTMNWTPGTDGLVRGPAVFAPTDMAEFNRVKSTLKGAWVVMSTGSTMRGPAIVDDELKKAIDGAGILGRLFGTKDERVHSHGNWRDKSFTKRPTDLNISVRRSDFDRISRNIEFGRPTVLEFNIENRWIPGPINQYNVVADLKGSEKPDEMVIVCGHLDSWNSPGSQGALDNGNGSCVAIEAARILAKSGVKPKRTVRFILWSGEEQGLLGSRGYVDSHKAEMDKVSAVLNDDGGTNYQGGYVGLETMKPVMEAAFAPTVKAFPDMPMSFDVVKEMPAGGSSDHAPFNWVGVPGFFTKETGRSDYGFAWHTQNDRFELAIPEYMTQSSTNHALVAFALANSPALLPRGPKPAPRQAMRLDHALAVGADHVYENAVSTDHDHEDDWTLELADRFRRMAAAIVRAR